MTATRLSIAEDRMQCRNDTIRYRTIVTRKLLDDCLATRDHWLAFNLIDAARVVWAKEYDLEFDKMAKDALAHARSLKDSSHLSAVK